MPTCRDVQWPSGSVGDSRACATTLVSHCTHGRTYRECSSLQHEPLRTVFTDSLRTTHNTLPHHYRFQSPNFAQGETPWTARRLSRVFNEEMRGDSECWTFRDNGVKITVFWDMTPCTLLKSCRRSEAPAASCYSVSVKAHGATFLKALSWTFPTRIFFRIRTWIFCVPVCCRRLWRL